MIVVSTSSLSTLLSSLSTLESSRAISSFVAIRSRIISTVEAMKLRRFSFSSGCRLLMASLLAESLRPLDVSVHDPHVAAVDELLELSAPLPRDGLLDLVRHEVLVGLALDVAEDADGLREIGLLHAREHEGDRWVLDVRVVDETVRFVEAGLRAQLDDLGARAVHAYAAVSVFAEDHRLAVFEIEHAVGADGPLGERVERAVVEDVAVLVDLYEADALVCGSRLDHRGEVLDVNVNGARDEGRLRGDGER